MMKKYLIIFIVLFSTLSYCATTVVQLVHHYQSSSSLTCTVNGSDGLVPITAGDTVVVGLGGFISGSTHPTVLSVSGDVGLVHAANTNIGATTTSNNSIYVDLYYVPIAIGGSTAFIVTSSTPVPNSDCWVAEYTPGNFILDDSNSLTDNQNIRLLFPSLSPVGTNDIFIGIVVSQYTQCWASVAPPVWAVPNDCETSNVPAAILGDINRASYTQPSVQFNQNNYVYITNMLALKSAFVPATQIGAFIVGP